MSDISPHFQRLEYLRLKKDWTWAQVGEAIGVKTAMIMMVKSGRRSLSDKALYRLDQVEREAGIIRLPGFNVPVRHVDHPPIESIRALRAAAKKLREEADRLDAQADLLENL